MRDDALYTLTDIRDVSPVRAFRGRADAVRVLLAAGSDVKWTERGDAWRSTGFISLKTADTPWGYENSENAKGAIEVIDPAKAWAKICAELEPEWFADLSPRLAVQPATLDAVLALAQGLGDMRAAEARVRELFERLAPFRAAEGGGASPRIEWRSITHREAAYVNATRSAFSAIHDELRRVLGRDLWHDLHFAARRECDFGSRSGPTHLYRWVADDLAGMRLFDRARSVDAAFKERDNPWESLVRIGALGFQAEVIAPERVLLVAKE